MKKNDLDNKPSPLWVLDTSELNPNLLLSYYHPTPTPARVPPLSLWGGGRCSHLCSSTNWPRQHTTFSLRGFKYICLYLPQPEL